MTWDLPRDLEISLLKNREMKEFGSDFHLMSEGKYWTGKSVSTDICPDAVYFANGRHAILTAVQVGGYKRLWVPVYFCHEVIASIRKAGIEVVFYDDYPLQKHDDDVVRNLPYRGKDALLRLNYFGWRKWRDNSDIPVPVIEDHTHDLIGHWARNSNADWCLASLRKSLPLPEGGVLWSPKGYTVKPPVSTAENDTCVEERLRGMMLKRDYLCGEKVEKNTFRGLYLSTEDQIGELNISGISQVCLEILMSFDIKKWYEDKKRNWEYLTHIEGIPEERSMLEDSLNCTPFSIVLEMSTDARCAEVRKKLIENDVYPAVLWSLPESCVDYSRAFSFSRRMLSVHCDGRYTLEDMEKLSCLLMKSLK